MESNWRGTGLGAHGYKCFRRLMSRVPTSRRGRRYKRNMEFNWRGTGIGAHGYKCFMRLMSRVPTRAPRPVPLHGRPRVAPNRQVQPQRGIQLEGHRPRCPWVQMFHAFYVVVSDKPARPPALQVRSSRDRRNRIIITETIGGAPAPVPTGTNVSCV